MPPFFSISCCQRCFVHGGLRFVVATTVAAWLDSFTRVAASAIADCRRGAAVVANHHHQPPSLCLLPMKREFEPPLWLLGLLLPLSYATVRWVFVSISEKKDVYYVRVLVCVPVYKLCLTSMGCMSDFGRKTHCHHREVVAATIHRHVCVFKIVRVCV